MVTNLSGGNQQKVILAKVLMANPHILFMDEPTKGIDIGAKNEIYKLMLELVNQGISIVMISSELPELLAMCDRFVVLAEGKVADEFSKEEASEYRVMLAATQARDQLTRRMAPFSQPYSRSIVREFSREERENGKPRQKIRETQVEPGSLAIFWLAQAGFVFKTSIGKVIYVDPYLTDYVQRVLPEYGLGFKRMMASLIAPEEVEADYVISTHSHADHFDGDAMPRHRPKSARPLYRRSRLPRAVSKRRYSGRSLHHPSPGRNVGSGRLPADRRLMQTTAIWRPMPWACGWISTASQSGRWATAPTARISGRICSKRKWMCCCRRLMAPLGILMKWMLLAWLRMLTPG